MLRYTEHQLKADDRPRTRYEYVVTGRGDFPLDMLRYDRCWPLSSSDVGKLEQPTSREPRSIIMASHTKPTVDRWTSFGWSCGTQVLHTTRSNPPVCRICGEEGHSWQRCGKD